MISFLYAACVLYALIGLFTIIGITIPLKKKSLVAPSSVTILVVARNEEKRIASTLAALQQLDLSGINAEFIFVDDGSSDATFSYMKNFTSPYPIRLLRIDDKNPLLLGKKDGITRAVHAAQGEVMLMTDADCTMSPQWAKCMLTHFSRDTVMLLGHVHYKTHNIHSFFSNFEALCGSIFTFSWARFNFAPYCRGANLAFRRSAFIDADGYSGMPVMASGDDMFLLQKLRRFGKCTPVYTPASHVTTTLHDTVSLHIEQQKRKYAKNFRYKWSHQILFVFGIIFHVLLITGLFVHTSSAVPLVIGKIGMEYLIFILGAIRLHAIRYISLFPFFIAIFPFEIILYSIWGVLRKYRWKSEEKIR